MIFLAEIPPPPPPTTVQDSLMLLGIVLIAGFLIHLLRGRPAWISNEADWLVKKWSAEKSNVVAALTRFHKTPRARLLGMLPFILMGLGNIGCSLLGDAGHTIFPWPLLAVGGLFGLGYFVAISLRHKLVRRGV